MLPKLRSTLRISSHLGSHRNATDPAFDDRPLLAPEEFQAELVILGLSGKQFSPKNYAESLERHLAVKITICVFPDAYDPILVRQLACSGHIAELIYSKESAAAVVLAPASLPPLVLTLALYHELAHLAAGDPLKVHQADSGTHRWEIPERRLACRPPLGDEQLREQEADLRAAYALLAGSLGSTSPFAERMYDIL